MASGPAIGAKVRSRPSSMFSRAADQMRSQDPRSRLYSTCGGPVLTIEMGPGLRRGDDNAAFDC